MALSEKSPLFKHLCEIYQEYRQTQALDAKAAFYSSQCRQICRQDPTYAARDPATIVRYLRESGKVINRIFREAGWIDDESGTGPATQSSYYSVRLFTESEANEFGTADVVIPAGFTSVQELKTRAKEDDWQGLMINMWTDDGHGRGLLVKVKYWWHLDQRIGDDDDGVWKQVLHDILYLGPRDGTDEREGGALFRD
ncbi:hypothetical protein FZEAL_3729 [Fusarium zealandicum]|uniref:SnoaL-like domain-containing protein n=1 Tax=Fusarium zealandicum TaxID=1053134 RepID=A0A8H4UNR0_9HYPO|nr:hypothetical protein FZEAL_3729 [Fusarium zealandicum]